MQTKITGLLTECAMPLADYLNRALPAISENWWNDAVLKVLSFQQRKRAEENRNASLSGLDLAALLRVLDRNWYQISNKMNLHPEARHFVKEMQTVRNRWAHAGSEGFPAEDVYRDLDTLLRFAKAIEARANFIESVKHIQAYYASRLQIQTETAPEPEVRSPLEPRLGRRRIVRPVTEKEKPKAVPRGPIAIKARKPRDLQLEAALKKSLQNELEAQWDESSAERNSQLVFPSTGKRVLCKYSSFDQRNSHWFWGVSTRYWTNWGPHDYLALIMENEDNDGYSFLLLKPEEASTLLDKCGESKNGEKKINLRLYMKDGEIRFQEWKDFDLKDRIKPLPIAPHGIQLRMKI